MLYFWIFSLKRSKSCLTSTNTLWIFTVSNNFFFFFAFPKTILGLKIIHQPTNQNFEHRKHNISFTEANDDFSHIRKNPKVVCIFGFYVLKYYPSPFEDFFSNEYNFFSIGHLLRLKQHVMPLLILFYAKTNLRSSLSVSQENLIFFVLQR